MLNKRILVLMFLLIFLPLAGCFPAPSNQAPIITSLPITAVTVGETYVYDVEATDPNGDTLTYSLTTGPTGMTINPATGLIKWTPKVKGNYAVFVKVSDGDLDITQSFTIVVSKPSAPPPVNHAPIITSTPNITTIVGIQYIYEVKATDQDGDDLTYSLIVNPDPDGMAIDEDSGVITWVPDATGSYDVTVKVSDGKISDTQSFTITVIAVELDHIVVVPNEITLFVGEIGTFKITAHYNFGDSKNVAYDCAYLSTSDAAKVLLLGPTSDSRSVKGLKVGKAIIAVSYTEGDITKTDTLKVEVIDLVQNTNTGKYYHTITDAIDEASAGDTIEVATGTYNGFLVNKDNITIRATGEAIITVVGYLGENSGIVIDTDASGVVIEGLIIDGSGISESRGIRGLTNAEYTVKNTAFTNLTTGIYANSPWPPIKAELTAIGNTFTNCVAGIGGTEETILNAIGGNTFTDCDEGIGLGSGVQTTIVPYDQLIAYLQDNNDFVNCIDDVKDWR